MTRINPSPTFSPRPDPLGSVAHLLTRPPKGSDPSQAVPLDRLEVPRLGGLARAEARYGLRPTRQRSGALAPRDARDARAERASANKTRRLTDAQRTERQRITTPRDGIGFAFGKADVKPEQLQRWIGRLSEDQRKALAHPRTQITITARTSPIGAPAGNHRLAKDRGEAVTAALRKLGFKGEIKVKHDIAPDRGKYDADERVAKLSIYSGEQRFHDVIRRTGRLARAADAARQARRQRPDVLPLSRLPAAVRQAVNKRILGGPTSDKPRRVGDHAILSHPASGRMGGVKIDDLRQGYSRVHGHFVHRRGDAVQVQPRCPDTEDQVREMAKRHGQRLDKGQVTLLAKAGVELNRLYSHYLHQGMSIEEARHHVRKGAARLLHEQVLGMLKITLSSF